MNAKQIKEAEVEAALEAERREHEADEAQRRGGLGDLLTDPSPVIAEHFLIVTVEV